MAYQVSPSMGFSRQEYWNGYFLLQGIFPTQGSNLGLLYGRQIFYHLSHQGSSFQAEGRANANVLVWNKFGDVLAQAAITKYHRLGPGLGCLRPNNYQGGSPTPPISRELD